jgi:uncharacterized protein
MRQLEDPMTTTYSDDECVLYLGSWDTGAQGGRECRCSNTQYNACLFSFRGPAVRWLGPTSNNQGFADVYIDEEFQCSLDGFSNTQHFSVVRFERRGLRTDTVHTIKIVVRKERNPSATDCSQAVESFQSVEPINYRARVGATKDDEYAHIRNGTKLFATANAWFPVSPAAQAPLDGVRLHSGMLYEMFQRNINYLTTSFALPHYCDPDHPAPSDGGPGWSQWLPASNEGRLLAGAAHSLRWEERNDLRTIVTTIVNDIANRMREDGYFNYYDDQVAYSQVTGLHSERKNYDRVFWTRGLLAAGMLGDPRAYDLLRRMYDWFNASPYLPDMLEGSNATNGLPGGPLMYLSPVGVANDLIVAERYYDQEYWIDALRNRDQLSFSHYPGERPHCYALLGLEAFIDEYLATGDGKYLDAATGGWDVFRDSYKHVGGAVAICEQDGPYWPKSFYITTGHNGETCGSVFWITINSKLLHLYPEREAYASEIEESLLNVIAAAQTATGTIRYHNRLHGTKEEGRRGNTCCEVSAAGLIGRLPEFIYSVDAEGFYVNMFAASSIRRDLGFGEVSLTMVTTFPYGRAVEIEVATPVAASFSIRVRIPCWAASNVVVEVNGAAEVVGTPGTYVALARQWSNGDVLGLTLPIGFSALRYTGRDQVEDNYDRYALKYGPVLMALCGELTGPGDVPRIATSAADLPHLLEPVADRPLEFMIPEYPSYRYVPYWMVDQEAFTCFPIVEPT